MRVRINYEYAYPETDFGGNWGGRRINDRSIRLHCESGNMKTLAAIPCHDEGLMNRVGRIEGAEVRG
ncbi:MAG: hypothetical protein U9N61_08325 [Euryarchaeota archaeon]|nr:hypothetical protein [Euryarchaeota archaeon]